MKLYNLYQQILSEEFFGSDLYGYHVTNKENLDSIRDSGFKIGHRAMQGKGIYSFYELDHAIRYGMKGEVKNPVIVKFKITSPKSLLYLDMDIAKKVLGSDYGLKEQINNRYWKGEKGLEGFIEGVRMVHDKNITMDELITKLDYIEKNNNEMTQRTFWASMIPSSWNDSLDVVLDGYYGTEIRINNSRLMYLLGYYELHPNKPLGDLMSLEVDLIPSDSKYDELRKVSRSTGYDLPTLKKHLKNLQSKVRNNIQFDYYSELIDLIRGLID